MKDTNFSEVIGAFNNQELDGLGAVCEETVKECLKEENGFFQSIMDGIKNSGDSGEQLAEEMDENLTSIAVQHLDFGFAIGFLFGQKCKFYSPEVSTVLAHIQKVLEEKGTFKFSPEAA
jgi:hypothetical protein